MRLLKRNQSKPVLWLVCKAIGPIIINKEYKTKVPDFVIKSTSKEDVPLIIEFIKELAEYEKLSHEVVVTPEVLSESLFVKKIAETVIGYYKGTPVCFAIFFHNLSTFIGKPGIYLEDLYVKPIHRGKGFGKAMLAFLARLAIDRDCARLEWAVLDWNQPAIKFYNALGARSMIEWTTNRLYGKALEDLAAKF